MSFVTVEQIKLKLKIFSELKQLIESECQSGGGTLPKHQWWRYWYYEFPYLIGSRSERIARRFCEVFKNVTELDSTGKITPYLGFAKDDSLTQKFTHLLEELNARGAITNNLIAEARKPILKYFENGDPIAVKLFKEFKPPSSPFLVKYSKKEFLEPMLAKGVIRICPASFYADDKHIDSVRDNETHRYFFIPTFRERLQGNASIEVQNHNIHFGDDDIEVPMVVPDYFMYSLCDHIYYRLPTDFDADAALIIKDPILFTQRVVSTFLSVQAGWHPLVGNVTYYDPYMDYTKVSVPEMAKHFGYSYQREYRIAFQRKSHIKTNLVPQFIKIGPMTDYAELIAL